MRLSSLAVDLCLKHDLQALLLSLQPEFQRALRPTIVDHAVLAATRDLLLERYGERVQWSVTAWGTGRVVLEPRSQKGPKEIVKVGMIVPDPPRHDLILAPLQTVIAGTTPCGRIVGAECYPLADILGTTDLTPYPEVRAMLAEMREAFRAAEFDVFDVHPMNIGLLPNGRLTLVDNEVTNLQETRFPRHRSQQAYEEWRASIQMAAARHHVAYEELRQRMSQDRSFPVEEQQRECHEVLQDGDVFSHVMEDAIAEDWQRTHDAMEAEAGAWIRNCSGLLQKYESGSHVDLQDELERIRAAGDHLAWRYHHSAALADRTYAMQRELETITAPRAAAR